MQTAQATRLFERAVIALRVGSRTAARRVLGRLVAEGPAQAAPWIALAHAAGSPLVAIDCLEKALALEADSAVARAGLEWHRWLLAQPGQSLAPAVVDPSNASPRETDRPETADWTEHSGGPAGPSEEPSEGTTLVADEPDDIADAEVEQAMPTDERGRSMLRQIDELEASLKSDLATAPALPSLSTTATTEVIPGVIWAPDAVTNPKVLPELVDEGELPASDPRPGPVASDAPGSSSILEQPVVEATQAGGTSTAGDVTLVGEPVVTDLPPGTNIAITTEDVTAEDVTAEAPLKAEMGLQPITEQELATTEWRRWVTGTAVPTAEQALQDPATNETGRTTKPSAESARLVNEVSERLALALQRVLGQRAEELVTTSAASTADPTADSPTVSTIASEQASPQPEETEANGSSDSSSEESLSHRHLATLPMPDENAPRILVVDDSATIRRVVVDGLTRHGYHVFEAGDGVEGIREIATRKPDLILLDITMPRLDGYRLCRLVKGHASTRHIPVVMLSGKDGTFDRLRGRLAGCSDYITKPFDSESLLAKVEQHLKVKVAKS
jgi:twitching motility two-component system response regulator PilG